MPANYGMFNRRANLDPEAQQLTGLKKMFAGWRLLLRDDKQALTGDKTRADWTAERKSLMEDPD
jgi:hypothetical protein